MTADQGIKIFNFIALTYFAIALLGTIDKSDYIGSAQVLLAATYVYASAKLNREDKHTLYLESY